MHRITFLLSLSLYLSACTQNLPRPELPSTLSPEIRIVYETGQAILLYHFDPQATHSEAYADWSAYLKDFKHTEGKAFYIQAIDTAILPTLINKTELINDFSLFIKKGLPSYLYPAVILEPQIYQAVAHKYIKQPLTKQDHAFLPEQVYLLKK